MRKKAELPRGTQEESAKDPAKAGKDVLWVPDPWVSSRTQKLPCVVGRASGSMAETVLCPFPPGTEPDDTAQSSLPLSGALGLSSGQ